MTLTQKDHGLFLKLYNELLSHTSHTHNLVAVITDPDDTKRSTIESLITARDYLYDHPTCFDEYVNDTNDLSEESKQIIADWKEHFVRDTFYVVKHTAHHSEFATNSEKHTVYAVHSLTTPFKEIFPTTPFMVNTVLLPFRGCIVSDGLFTSNNVIFGGSMAKSIKMESEHDKVQYGLVHSLPRDAVADEDAEALLAFYCKSWANFEEYRTERCELLDKHRELMDTYYRHIGKLASRELKKELREILSTKTHVAVYKETVVATASNAEDLQTTINTLVAPRHHDRLYTFELRPKK